ncbi:DUF881 domain-containing protein [Halobacillus fulvus]|nr:DUF881 domain-containing protein [Halobacillus fulvus]
MKNKPLWMVSFICLLIGFMVAVQYQTTTAEPEVRDTRDEWEVREALIQQQEVQQDLLEKISAADETLTTYEAESSQQQLNTLRKSIDDLEARVGLTEVEGMGVELTISPIFLENVDIVQEYPVITPSLLMRLINDLNKFGAEEISIGGERLTNLSPIRDVNGSTYLNNRPLPSLPLNVQILTDQPERLKNYMEASTSSEMFMIENLDIQMEVKEQLKLPKYEDPLYLEIFEETGE